MLRHSHIVAALIAALAFSGLFLAAIDWVVQAELERIAFPNYDRCLTDGCAPNIQNYYRENPISPEGERLNEPQDDGETYYPVKPKGDRI